MSTVLQPSLSAYDVAGGTLTAGKPALLHNRCGIVVKQDMGGRAWKDALTNPETIAVTKGLMLLTNGRVEVDDTYPASALGDLVYISAAHTLHTQPLTDEIQKVTVPATVTTFTLTYSGQTTSALTRATADGAAVQTALIALSNIGPGDVAVSGPAGGPYIVQFGGALADADIAALTATTASGTGTIDIATLLAGGTAAVAFGRVVAAAGQRGLRATQIRVDLDDKG